MINIDYSYVYLFNRLKCYFDIFFAFANLSAASNTTSSAMLQSRKKELHVAATGSKGQRRRRTDYTVDQIKSLEEVFLVNQYPDFHSREALAQVLGLLESRVQVLFTK